MKRLNPKRVRDLTKLDDLASNTSLSGTSYPELSREKQVLIAAYADYEVHRGNAIQIAIVNISNKLQTGLIAHYESPPSIVDYKDSIRNSSPDVCPMCGSQHPRTLDHVLPKSLYPAWSIFSKNLVPACSCNQSRSVATFLAGSINKRVLHPYFDDCLDTRLLSTSFEYPEDLRWVRAKLSCVDESHPDIDAIKYHVKHIIERNGIDTWFRGKLNKIKNSPQSVITQLPRREAIQAIDLPPLLQDTLETYDEQHGTPNNWYSILLHGLLNESCLHEWIVDNHNRWLASRAPT
ncbi:HNH endonuclease [Shewanella sp. 125m-1]